jgi:RecA-family ATPase
MISGLEILTKELPAVDYCLEPVIAKGKVTDIQGEPKVGKSIFALTMAVCMALGLWIYGRFGVKERRTVIYLAAEDASNLIQERVRGLRNGIEGADENHLLNLILLPQEACLQLDVDLAKPDGPAKLQAVIRYAAADVVFLDSLSNFNNAEENQKDRMQPVMSALKRIAVEENVALVFLHHAAKPTQGVQRSVVGKGRGSGVIAAAWDILLDLGDRGSTNTTPAALKSKLGADDTFDLIYQDDGKAVRWTLADSMPTEDRREIMGRVMKALRELFKTSPEGVKVPTIAAAVALSGETVRQYLQAAFEAQQVDRKQGDKNAWLYTPVKA